MFITLRWSEQVRTKLKQFRVGTKLTQAEFAAKIGVSREKYGFVETGQTTEHTKGENKNEIQKNA